MCVKKRAVINEQSLMSSKGFTLLEAMLVVALMAIVVAIAAPSFSRQIQRSEVRRVASDFQIALEDTKRKAYVAGRNFTLCPVEDITLNTLTCLNSWSKFDGKQTTSTLGWVVFHDKNKNKQVDSDEVIVTKTALGGHNVALEWTGGNGVITLTPRNKTGSSGTMRVYLYKKGSLEKWKNPPPSISNNLREMRVSLSPLGTVKFYN